MGPDGRTAAFIWDRDTSDVWAIDTVTGSTSRLTTGRALAPWWEDTRPVVSPDGVLVAYGDGDQVWVVPVDGGPPRAVVEGSEPVWTAAGLLLVGVERDRCTVLAQVDPRRSLAGPRGLRRRGLLGGRPLPGRHPRGLRVLASCRPQPVRDPRRGPRHRRGPRPHGHARAPRPGRDLVARRHDAGFHRRAPGLARGLPHRGGRHRRAPAHRRGPQLVGPGVAPRRGPPRRRPGPPRRHRPRRGRRRRRRGRRGGRGWFVESAPVAGRRPHPGRPRVLHDRAAGAGGRPGGEATTRPGPDARRPCGRPRTSCPSR